MERPFGTAIIDPPWPYSPNAKTIGKKAKARSGYVLNPRTQDLYSTMTLQEIADDPRGRLADYVFLWITGPFLLRGAHQPILSAWGLEAASMLTWAKYDIKGQHGYGGVGYWFLGNAEFCIVAKRPGWQSLRTGKSSLFIEKKGRHSAKPDNIHKICEDCFPGPYLEVFARIPRKGWTQEGDQLNHSLL